MRRLGATLTAAVGLMLAMSAPAAAGAVGWHAATVPIASGCSLNAASRVPNLSTFWVVGGCGGARAIALRYTRHGWVDTPPEQIIGYRNAALFGVAAANLVDAWTVGSEEVTQYRRSRSLLVQHWDGTNWAGIAAPQPGHEFSSRRVLRSVAYINSTSVWAVGAYRLIAGKPYRPLAEHWDGTSWHIVNPPIVGHRGSRLNGIAVVPHTKDFYAFGWYQARGGRHRPLVIRRHRGRWVVEKPQVASLGSFPLYAGIVTDHGRTVWAVGRHVLERRTNGIWQQVPLTPSDADLRAITRIPGTRELWAVGKGAGPRGEDGLAERFDGVAWQPYPLPRRETLTGVTAIGTNDAWAVGKDGHAEHYH